MIISAIVASAAVTLGLHPGADATGFDDVTNRFTEGRLLVHERSYPANVTDGVHRPGFNGRVYRTRPIVNRGPWISTSSIRQDRYGAYGAPYQYVPVRAGLIQTEIDPYKPIHQTGFRRFEAARNAYLKREGLVGGVRTFVNDAHDYGAMSEAAPRTLPEPRLKLRVPDKARRLPQLRVDAGARISWPPHAPIALRNMGSAEAVAQTDKNR